ncbi:MAG: hypothetical protein AAB036_03415 [Elusimicrobiota bacterium]
MPGPLRLAARKAAAAALAACLVVCDAGCPTAALARQLRSVSAAPGPIAAQGLGVLPLGTLPAPLLATGPLTLRSAASLAVAPAPIPVAPRRVAGASFRAGAAARVAVAAKAALAPAVAVTPSLEIPDVDAKTFADKSFRLLVDEAPAQTQGREDLPGAPRPSTARGRARAAASSLGAFVGGAAAVATVASPPASLPVPSLSELGAGLGQLGYLLGNFLSFAFPYPEIKKAVVDGHVSSPLSRVAILVVFNTLLAAIVAPLGGLAVWGVQNAFTALAIVSAWPAAYLSRRFAGDKGLGRWQAEAVTAAAMLVSAAAGVALYFAAAAVMPGVLTSWLGAAGAAELASRTLQVASIAYLFLFLPDILSVFRGQPVRGFTSSFALLFMISSLAMLIWSGRLSYVAAPDSLDRGKYGVMAVSNVIYMLVSGLSWWFSRHEDRKKT